MFYLLALSAVFNLALAVCRLCYSYTFEELEKFEKLIPAGILIYLFERVTIIVEVLFRFEVSRVEFEILLLE